MIGQLPKGDRLRPLLHGERPAYVGRRRLGGVAGLAGDDGARAGCQKRCRAAAHRVQTAGVSLLKLTAKPDEAVALRATGASPRVRSGGWEKLMVCARFCTANDRLTLGAAPVGGVAGLAGADGARAGCQKRCRAAAHTADRGVSLLKAHLLSPDEAVALRATGASPRVRSGGWEKLMVCARFCTVNDRLSLGAGL